MEHVPVPSTPGCSPLEVPYLVARHHRYDKKDFLSFPSRLGVIIAPYGFASTNPAKAITFQDACSIAQSWLFFGILEDICSRFHVPFNRRDFVVHKENGKRLLTTTKLLPILHGIAAARKRSSSRQDAKADIAARHAPLSQQVWKVGIILSQWIEVKDKGLIGFARTDDELRTAQILILSFNCLLEGITNMLDLHGVPLTKFEIRVEILDERLIEAGWCRNIIKKLHVQLDSPTCLYYLSCMKGPQPSKHLQCTADVCIQAHIDDSSYEMAHAPGCDQKRCKELILEDSLETQTEDRPISRCLELGMLPTVVVMPNVNDCTLTVRQNNFDFNEDDVASGEYVAISHVWSDGLGNPHKNSIYACQAQRLQTLVNKTFPHVADDIPFWLDTLCVPKDPKAKRIAISKMKEAYARAERVLVLDSFLYESSPDIGLDELTIKLAASLWMTRLWTLQEALYAKDLRIQAGDTNYPLSHLIQFWSKSHISQELNTPARAVVEVVSGTLVTATIRLESLAALQPNFVLENALKVLCRAIGASLLFEHTPGQRLQILSSTLQMRNTSRASDEAICLASILGLDPTPLLDVEADERMRMVLTSMPDLPVGLLFSSRPRYKERGSRWIPRTLLWQPSHPEYMRHSLSGSASSCERGMLVKLPAVRIRKSTQMPRDSICLPFTMMDQIWVAIYYQENVSPVKNYWVSYSGRELALLFRKKSRDNDASETCVLVTIENEEDGVIYARREADAWAFIDTTFSPYDKPSKPIDVEVIPDKQTWCVG